MQRRDFLSATGKLAFSVGAVLPLRHTFADTATRGLDSGNVRERLRELETAAAGRLGVCIIDTKNGQAFDYRADERFLMLSSFKLLASALVLHRVDSGKESLHRRIQFSARDLVEWSPVTERHVGGNGMSLAQLCHATLTTSDNTAANLILASYGGPGAVTSYVRLLGDAVTRLDRNEPALNQWHANGVSDTSTPRAMALTMQKLVLGDALSPVSRQQLLQWLLANTTGDRRLKAGLPAQWRIGEKTGTNKADANDIGIAFPPSGRAPLLVSAYLADSRASREVREATLAAVGRLVAQLDG